MTEDTATVPRPVQPDPDKLMEFVFRVVGEVGASLNAALVVMGDELGYYRSLVEYGPSTPEELATHTGTDAHYTREWLNAQAAGDFVTYDPGTARYTLPPEQAVVLSDTESPYFLQGLFQTAYGSVRGTPEIVAASRTGGGVGWDQQNSDVHEGCERFFAPGYAAHLVAEWLPALDGVVDKLTTGAQVADIGCGYGASTIVMARAFPASTFTGSDYHQGSVDAARRRAIDAGTTNVRFQREPATQFSGDGYALVTTFDCLHDMGDPVGVARRVRNAITGDGTWMVVEPAAGDHVEDNLGPVGRAYYGFSTLLCTPNSLSQDVRLALGAQAGPARIRDIVSSAGFSGFRIAAQTPFNNVFEVRP